MLEAFKLFPDDEKEWNTLLNNSINCTYLSTLPYAYTKASIGKQTETYLFKDDGENVAGAHYSIKYSSGKIISVADIQTGFIFRKDPTENVVAEILGHFENWAKSKNASFIRIYPMLPAFISGTETYYSQLFGNLLKVLGYKEMREGLHTYWLDLTKSEEDLLRQMKRQTRYEINRALNSHLKVERYDRPTDDLFNAFWELYHNLGKMKKFNVLNKEQIKQEFFSLMKSGFANMFVVRCNNNIVNVSLASNFGRAAYMYGAMDPDFKTIAGCTSPGQIAQWEMIRYMKSRGVKTYDLGLCPGPVPKKDHPQYPIWRFKYGFGGTHVQFLPEYGKSLKPLRGKLFQIIKCRS